MIQDYCIALFRWCETKVLLWSKQSEVLFKEGEIWWCSIGMNVGMEIYGKGPDLSRPVLIFKKFNCDLFFGIPLTSKKKEGNWYVPISYGSGEGGIVLHQGRSMDKKRLIKRIGTMKDERFTQVRQVFANFYCVGAIKNDTPSCEITERVGESQKMLQL